MSSIGDLQRILGPSPWGAGNRTMVDVSRELGVTLPGDVEEVLCLYGDVLISDFICLYGPKIAVEKALWMNQLVQNGNGTIPHPVLPSEGGMFHFGHTVEGDNLFLENRSGGWRVLAFRRGWADWLESDLTLVDWLLRLNS